jgi:hypothetical protein
MEQRLEAVKSYSSKFLKSRRILLIEVSNLLFSVSEICCGFPRVKIFFIAFLFDSILELLTEDIEIYNLVDFVFFFIFYYNRFR